MKKSLFLYGKIVISTALIILILQTNNLSLILGSIQSADLVLLSFALALIFLSYWFIAIRTSILLKAQGFDVKLVFLVQSFSVGMFFSNFLPSTVGGDLSRMYDLWRKLNVKGKAATTIFLDRIFGLYALILIGFFATFYAGQVHIVVPNVELILGFLVLIMSCAIYVVFGALRRPIQWFFSLKLNGLRFFKKIVIRLLDSVSDLFGNWTLVFQLTGIALIVQSVNVASFYLIGIALGMQVTFVDMAVIIALLNTALLLPISINGIGVREAVTVFLLGAYFVDSVVAVSFAWIGLGFVVFQGILGGCFFMLRASKSNVSIKGMREFKL